MIGYPTPAPERILRASPSLTRITAAGLVDEGIVIEAIVGEVSVEIGGRAEGGGDSVDNGGRVVAGGGSAVGFVITGADVGGGEVGLKIGSAKVAEGSPPMAGAHPMMIKFKSKNPTHN